MKPVLAAAALLFSVLVGAAATRVVVDAGRFDRRDTVVEFEWPQGAPDGNLLVDEEGGSLFLQKDGRRASFIIPALRRGERKEYKVERGAVRTAVRVDTNASTVLLRAYGRDAFVYHLAKTELPSDRPDLKPIFRRGGYLHPVLSPSGLQVTDDYPRNHKHHHGLWHSWSMAVFEGRTNDYWNMGDGKGTLDVVALESAWSGPVHGGFRSRHRQVDLTSGAPKVALNETWAVRLYGVGNSGAKPYFLFDVTITNTCASPAPVQLPQYRYGGVCVRGNWAWNGRTNAFVLTSEGDTDRSKGDKGQVRARWVHLGGFVNGTFTGIAGLTHPSNPMFPEPVRLNPAEPYFNFAPQQSGSLEITAERPFVARYRFVVADGKPEARELDRLWNDYAHPPVVTLE